MVDHEQEKEKEKTPNREQVEVWIFGTGEQCERARDLIELAVEDRARKDAKRQAQYEKKKEAKRRARELYYLRHRQDYAVLGVAVGAPKSILRKAYRKLAIQYHPDKNQGDAEAERMFQEVARAYESLMSTDEEEVQMQLQ